MAGGTRAVTCESVSLQRFLSSDNPGVIWVKMLCSSAPPPHLAPQGGTPGLSVGAHVQKDGPSAPPQPPGGENTQLHLGANQELDAQGQAAMESHRRANTRTVWTVKATSAEKPPNPACLVPFPQPPGSTAAPSGLRPTWLTHSQPTHLFKASFDLRWGQVRKL